MADPMHLDDEALSAVLDGEASPEEATHAESCTACSTRLGVLRDASLLVSAPVSPPDPDRRESAITAAMASSDADAIVVPLHRRLPPAWLAAAAALVIAIGAIALARGGSSSDRAATSAAASTTEAGGAATAGGNAAPFDAMASAAAPVDGGDLGTITATDLKERIDVAMATRQSAKDAASGSSTGAPAPPGRAAAATPCEASVRAGNAHLGALVLHATATFHGERVVVLAFDVGRTNGSSDRWVYVLVPDGCGIRNQQTYAGG